jgi:hypothetical protein
VGGAWVGAAVYAIRGRPHEAQPDFQCRVYTIVRGRVQMIRSLWTFLLAPGVLLSPPPR